MSFLFGNGVERDLWVRLGFADKPDGARFETGRDYAAEYNNPYGQNLPGDRDALVKLRERYPAANFRDITGAIDAMRNIKRPQEIEVLRRNGRISALGDKQAITMAHPNMWEYQMEAEAEYVFRYAGAQGLAYPAIVGAGRARQHLALLLQSRQDRARQYRGLRLRRRPRPHDHGHHPHLQHRRQVHRPSKPSGTTSIWNRRRPSSICCVPGNTYEQAADAGKKVFEREGVGSQWMGFPGHFVGLATHDVMLAKGPIQAGQVVTVEPIVEFPDKHWHFRVEDTILITPNGAPEVLSSGIPKEMTRWKNWWGRCRRPEAVK